jgi:hypothetical protein
VTSLDFLWNVADTAESDERTNEYIHVAFPTGIVFWLILC